MTLDQVQSILGGTINGDNLYTRCPYHDDKRASLWVGLIDDKLCWKCYAGCKITKPPWGGELERKAKREHTPFNWDKVTGIYDYTDLIGRLVIQKLKDADKNFLIRRPGDDGWAYGTPKGKDIPLYNTYRLKSQGTVYVCEGEKDCNTLTQMGLLAVTNYEGGAKWRDAYSWLLVGRQCVILEDNDEVGVERVETIKKSLYGLATVGVLTFKDMPKHSDITDYLNQFPNQQARKLALFRKLGEIH